jgi:two-component system sensor histidine kinase MprB
VRVLTAQFGPSIAVMVARPLDEVDGTLSRLAFVLALVTGGAALAGGLLGRLAARPVLTPVRELGSAVDHVSLTGDLSRRIVVDGRDEVAHLGERFNGMLDALETADASQRRLVADASHELRTPLTSVRMNLELLVEDASMPLPERERMLRDATLQVEELSGLVAGLVDLARGEQPAAAMVDLRLDELAAGAVERARRHAPQVSFDLQTEPVHVRGDAARLERALANVLGNAAAWSNGAAAVEVEVRDRGLTVRDHGPGFDQADLPHIFERFYRAPAARGRPGSGLGLAIVRQVADEHGATVTASNAEGGGARVTLRFAR